LPLCILWKNGWNETYEVFLSNYIFSMKQISDVEEKPYASSLNNCPEAWCTVCRVSTEFLVDGNIAEFRVLLHKFCIPPEVKKP
jgi:hypothetical protein